jgi:Glucodextranase, domain B
MSTDLLRNIRLRCNTAYYLFAILLLLSSLSVEQTRAAAYPPVGSEITSLQETYNQANSSDTIRAKNKIFTEALIFDRPISINLKGGYSDTTYITTNGSTSLHGTLSIRNGTLRVSNLAVSGSGSGGLAISAVTVTMPRIAWTTDQLADSRVDYGETTGYGMSVSGTDLTTSHSLVLTGLKPNTTYHYIVSSSTSGASAATADNTFTTPDFIAATVADIGNSAVIEVAGDFDTTNPDSSINSAPRQKVAQEYYKTHNDNLDFLVIFSTFDYAMPDPDTQGVYMSVRNDTLGINQIVFDNSTYYGSNSKLQGTIDMGNVSALAVNPYGEQLNQTLTVLSHEFAHRFGAYVRYKLPDNSLSTALLGKDNSHWSYLLDSQGSVMYGNGWSDNGDGTFTSTTIMNSYSPLDLYLMGMIPKEQVPSMLLIDNPAIDKTQLPFLGATINGTASTVSINDIVAAEGERVPSASTSQKQFNVGYILLVRHGDSMGQAAQTLDVVRKGFAGRFAEQTNGIGSIVNVPASLEVVFDTPANNSTITGPSVQVTGAVINTTGAETGVLVNGVPATVNGSRFIANAVDLQQGTNTITAIATDINARTSSATRTVTAQIGNYIRVKPNIESGIAPLDIALAVNGTFTISSSTLTYSGPVAVSLLPGSIPTSYLVRLPAEGTYTLTVQTTGPDGLTYEDSANITVLPRIKLDNLFRSKWKTMKTALAVQNIPGALQVISSNTSQLYNDTFTALQSQLPQLVQNMQDIQFINAGGSSAKYRIRKNQNYGGQVLSITHYIYFSQDENGLWKIERF